MSNPQSTGISQSSKRALRNPWVLGWLALVFIVLGVNTFFIAAAITTSPGLVEEDYYEKGRDHEQNWLKKREARNALGWQMNLQVPEEIGVNNLAGIHFNVVDKAGLPLEDAVVMVTAYRPSDASADFTVQLKKIAPGIYSADMRFLLKGIWDLMVTVQDNDDSLELRRRISVRG